MRFIAELASASVYSWVTATPHQLVHNLLASSAVVRSIVTLGPRLLNETFSSMLSWRSEVAGCIARKVGTSVKQFTASSQAQPKAALAGLQATDLQRVAAVLPIEVEAQGTAGAAGATGCPDHHSLAVQPAVGNVAGLPQLDAGAL